MGDELDDWMQPHTMTVRALLGSGGMGATFAPAVDRPCFAEESVKLVRDAAGVEVVSSAQVTTGFEPAVPVGSMVAYWGGRERRVIAVGRHEAPDWPAYQTLYLE